MRDFTVAWDHLGAIEHLEARAFLGVTRAARLDEELQRVVARLAACPESGQRIQIRPGVWSDVERKIPLSRSPYVLFYRLDIDAERVTILRLRHERARPLKFNRTR